MPRIRFSVWQPGYATAADNGKPRYTLAPFSRCANCGDVTPHKDEVIGQRGKTEECASLPPLVCPHCKHRDIFVDVPEVTKVPGNG